MNIDKLRQDTPGCKNHIHFNNAGASLMPQPVLDAVTHHLNLEAKFGGYEAAAQQNDAVERAYTAIAGMLNAKPVEVALTENATRAWDMAFYGLDLKAGQNIVTSMAEYGSNYIAYLQRAKKTGVEIRVVPNDVHGQIDVSRLASFIDDNTALITLTHIPTGGGLVSPAAAVGEVARAHDIPFLLDACQAAGQIPLDVNELGCDILTATGRKYLRGPRGTGFLWMRESLIEKVEPPFLDIHSAVWTGKDSFEIRKDARRFETWESFIGGKVGLGVAVDYALNIGLDAIRDRVYALGARARAGLASIEGVTVTDEGEELCGIITFIHERIAPAEIAAAMAKRDIVMNYSPVEFTRLSFEARGLETVARASLHYYNTEEEVDTFLEAMADIAKTG